MPLTAKDIAGLYEKGEAQRASGAQEEKMAKLKSYLQGQEQEQSINRLQGMMESAPEGSGANVTAAGAGFTRGFNPVAQQQKATQGDAQARLKANATYNAGLPKIQQVAQAASEGLDFTNDPQNIGSLGQARTLMLKAMGMNRYNEQEAKAVLPPSIQGHVANIFNAAGGDMSPLNNVQKSSINQFFKSQLDTAAMQHKMLKQNAMNVYSTSPYMSDAGMQTMGALGAPVEQQLSQAASKYKDVSTTKGPDLSGTNPTTLDRIKTYFGQGSSQPAPQGTSAPPMSFEDWKKANGR